MPEPKAPHANCEECPLLKKPCAQTIKAIGKPVAAFVSRSPGYHESRTGKPFSGPSGKVLDFLLNEQGINRKDVLLTNTVLCAPDEGEVPPAAIKACAPRLKSELDGISLVIAAGREAVNLLIGRGAIDKYRGYRIQQEGRIVVATNNPALVLRDDSTFPNLKKDFRRAFNPLPEPKFPKVEVIEDADGARQLLHHLHSSKSKCIAADIESRGGLTHKASLVSIQFSVDGRTAYVLGERGGLWENDSFVGSELRPFLESEDHRFLWHNGKFDVKILRYTYGINARIDEDTLLLSYDLDERSGQTEKAQGGYHKLEYLLSEEFGWPDYEPNSVKQFKKDGVVRDYDEFHEYAGRDVAGTYQLYELLSKKVKEEKLERPYRELLIEGAEACSRIEPVGFFYNVQAAADMMEEEVNPELRRLTASLREIIDNPLFKPRSPLQASKLFYNDWRIVHAMRDRPDKDRSVDVAALNEIIAGRFTNGAGITKGDHEYDIIIQFATELKRFRQLAKQADTYIVGLIERAIQDPDEKIYTDLLMHGTTTGRLSSRNPNLQNITRTKPDLPDIRSLFLASPGRLLVQADYSQAELRCIAYFSQDPELLRIYNEDLDLHGIAASNFYGENFTSEQRSRAKNMNFGLFYGQSAATFREKHDIPEKEAQQYIDWAWKNFSSVREFKTTLIANMRKRGYVESPFGRRRRFHLITKENANAIFREAFNFLPQSTAGDFTLRSVIVLQREIDPKRAAILITVHDNIVSDVKESYVDEYSTVCRQVMENRPLVEIGWTIPFKIDIGVGNSWGAAK